MSSDLVTQLRSYGIEFRFRHSGARTICTALATGSAEEVTGLAVLADVAGRTPASALIAAASEAAMVLGAVGVTVGEDW